jgi:hypothetical protein
MVTIITEDAESVSAGIGIATSVSVARGAAASGRSALLGMMVVPASAAAPLLVRFVALAAAVVALVAPDRTTVTLTVMIALLDCARRSPGESRTSAAANADNGIFIGSP